MMNEQNNSELQQIVRKHYLKILEREPNLSGLKFYVDKIKHGQIRSDQLEKIFMGSEEYKQLCEKKKILDKFQQFVKKPIFVIGVPRSGTTLIYSILSRHPDLAWFSHEDLPYWIPLDEQRRLKKYFNDLVAQNKKFQNGEASLFVFGSGSTDSGKGTSKIPIEGETFWHKYFGDSYVDDIPLDSKIEVVKNITEHLDREKNHRFLNKAPQNSKRLFAIKKIFPDAKFIQIIRDPRAVISSMIERHRNEGQFNLGIPVKDKEKYEKLSFVEKWAWQYKEIMEAIYEFSKSYENNLYVVIYEDLISDPNKELKKILEFCELPLPKKNMVPPILDTKSKWKENLTDEDQKKILYLVMPILQKVNYVFKT
ncbi:MAG TPA: sulfotransferase [Nitrosopumilaceae archaeon]|nr:sulfotransferase [Nitrosopumilaceae archaeon]